MLNVRICPHDCAEFQSFCFPCPDVLKNCPPACTSFTPLKTNFSPPKALFEDDFSFPQVGYVSFLESKHLEIFFSRIGVGPRHQSPVPCCLRNVVFRALRDCLPVWLVIAPAKRVTRVWMYSTYLCKKVCVVVTAKRLELLSNAQCSNIRPMIV